MQLRTLSLAFALLCASATSVAGTVKPASIPWNGSLFSSVNKIVGMWHAQVSVAPCNGGPTTSFLGINIFNVGGTLSDANTFPPTARGPGMGVWAYTGRNQDGSYQYKSHFQFARFKTDGTFDGLQDVHQVTTLQADGNSWTSSVNADVLNADGSLRVQLCGAATGSRVPLE